jgi:hypothetical protein
MAQFHHGTILTGHCIPAEFFYSCRVRVELAWGWGNPMMLAPFAGAALLISVATGPIVEPNGSIDRLSVGQKNAALQKFVKIATDCIARTVASDPRFREKADLGELIVDSMPTCVGPVRAMIDLYDRYFGDGTGEIFFMGPYLDTLPTAVTKWVRDGVD